MKITITDLNDGQNDYTVIFPKDYDPNKKYSTLVYMHGSGEVGTNAQNLLNSSLPKTLLSGGLNNMQENFDGIIILPHLKGGNWCNEKAEAQIRKTLADAQSKFSIDKDNICVGGHSLGGMGTIYMAKHMDDVFKKAAVFSGYNVGSVDLSSIKIPVIGIVGGSGDGSSYDYMYGTKNHPSKFRQAIGNNVYVVGSAHGSVPGVGLQQLKTEDGKRPLIFDWLFG